MRIIFIAIPEKLDCYLDDLTSFLNRDNVTADLYSLSHLNRTTWKNFWKKSWDKRHIHLEQLIRRENPDVILFNASRQRFDFERIRSFYRGRIIFYDMEGPNFPGFKEPEWISFVDAVVTVSDFMRKKLKSSGYDNVFYMPHGVNMKRFFPLDGKIEDERIFIGRPALHRIDCFTRLAKNGFPVRLYGRKWHELPEADPALEASFSSIKENINGHRLLERISSGRMFVNVLQDQFVDARTLINMQVFFIAACRRGVITEYVEELPPLFEPDKEILIYRSWDELLDKIRFCHEHPAFADSIAQAAYLRTASDHTLQQRSDRLLNLITSL